VQEVDESLKMLSRMINRLLQRDTQESEQRTSVQGFWNCEAA